MNCPVAIQTHNHTEALGQEDSARERAANRALDLLQRTPRQCPPALVQDALGRFSKDFGDNEGCYYLPERLVAIQRIASRIEYTRSPEDFERLRIAALELLFWWHEAADQAVDAAPTTALQFKQGEQA